MTLKDFRASKATNLPLEGKPTHAIMQAQEWKSDAVLHYCSADVMDLGASVSSVTQEDAVVDESSK